MEPRQDRPQRGDRGEGRRDRGDGRRGDRRGERGPRETAATGEAAEASALAGAATSVGMVTDLGDPQAAPAADAVLESHTHQDAGLAEAQDGEERRGRSRDRYGRDRRERGDRQPREEGTAAPVAGSTAETGPEQGERPRYPTGFVNEEPEAAAVTAGASAPSLPAPVAAVPASLPKVQPFQLPVDDLIHVAEGSGLQWVNSDAEKIAAAQAAIAAEPQPARVPRERPPAIVIDEGPLVLVETKRDLRELKLPFEQASLPLQ